MFKPAPMVKARAIVLEEYIEDVLREFSRLGSVQVRDVKENLKDLTPDVKEKTIERCSNLLRRIYYLIDVLDISEERDVFGSLKNIPERILLDKKTSMEYLDDAEKSLSGIEGIVLPAIDEIEKLHEETSLLDSEKFKLQCLKDMGVQVSWLRDSKFLYIVAGLTDDKEKLTGLLDSVREDFILKEGSGRDGKISLVLATLKENKDKVENILSHVEFERFTERKIGNLEELKKRLSGIKDEGKFLQEKLDDTKKYSNKILVMREIVQIEKNIAELGHVLGKTNSAVVVEGWIPKKRTKELIQAIERSAKGHSVVKIIEPEKDELIPTCLDNPKFIKPFEVITETFGLPGYRELDPTPFLAFTFPLFFGMMFGDAGQGIILVLLGLIIAYSARKNRSVKSLGIIIVVSGIFATFFGFMYGDLFGVGPEEQEKVFGMVILDTRWINPLHSPMDFLSAALYIGIIQIGTGLVMKFINKISEGEIFNAFLEPLPKLWFYYGSVAVIIIYGLNIKVWISNIQVLALASFIPLTIILLTEIIKHLPHISLKNIPTLLSEGGFEVFDTLILFLSNTISYSRIFALALVHAGLFLALFAVAEMLIEIPFVGIAVYLLVIVLGTIIIMALESLIVFLHSLRLHYYEWFSKFFKATGVKYQPFKAERVYTNLLTKG